MIKWFFRKNKKHSDKYVHLIRQLKLKETNDIEENLMKLSILKKDLNKYNFNDLKLMRIEVNALAEDYKQITLLTTTVTTIVAALTIFVNLIKDSLLKLNSSPFSLLFFLLINILYVGVILIMIILMIGGFASRSKDLIQLLNIIDLVINEREEINQLHEEAYKDHLKFMKTRFHHLT